MICARCSQELIEVDNPMRREVRHRRGEERFCPAYTESLDEAPWDDQEDDPMGGYRGLDGSEGGEDAAARARRHIKDNQAVFDRLAQNDQEG